MNRDKLIAAKENWAREGRLLVPAPGERRRLPPGQELVRDWPVLDLGTQPNLRPRDWRFTAGGLVETPIDWGWADLARLRLGEHVSDIHCVTGWSRYDNRWGGVATTDLLAILRPKAEARYVRLRSYDSYSTTLPLADFAAQGALLATHWAGEPLTRAHGGPVRLVVPQLYFWKSAKWLRHLWFTDRDAPGYWEARGYHAHGDPWRQERYR
jgi:DMSO/TMAO reductase YedYZ molybdopterin-dependent catalytic subunit